MNTAYLGILGRVREELGKDDSNSTDNARVRVWCECSDGEEKDGVRVLFVLGLGFFCVFSPHFLEVIFSKSKK